MEQRRAKRDPGAGVTAFVHRGGETVLEGVVQNVSDRGAKIAGNPVGINVGDAVEIVAIVQGERVKFDCEVRHVDPEQKTFGVRFQSGPQRVVEKPSTQVRRCMNCRRDFDPDCRFCSQCGQKLVVR